MFPLSVLSPFLGSFFMPLVSVKFSDHCHFLHFFAELLELGGNIARNICRLIVDCAGHWHRAEMSLIGYLSSYFNRSRIRIRKKKKKASSAENKVCNMFAFCLAWFLPGCNLFQQCSLRNCYTFQAERESEGLTTSIWRNIQLQSDLDLCITKVGEALELYPLPNLVYKESFEL